MYVYVSIFAINVFCIRMIKLIFLLVTLRRDVIAHLQKIEGIRREYEGDERKKEKKAEKKKKGKKS